MLHPADEYQYQDLQLTTYHDQQQNLDQLFEEIINVPLYTHVAFVFHMHLLLTILMPPASLV